MYKERIKHAKEVLAKFEKRQKEYDASMSWEEACAYMAESAHNTKGGQMKVRDNNGAIYHGYVGIGILYAQNTFNADPLRTIPSFDKM